MERDCTCFSGHPAVPLKAGFERFSASLGFAAEQDVQGQKQFMSANEGIFFKLSPYDSA